MKECDHLHAQPSEFVGDDQMERAGSEACSLDRRAMIQSADR